jgi:hypothetical protein
MTIDRRLIMRAVKLFTGSLVVIAIVAAITVARTWGRTEIQVDIHQNKNLIHLSTFAEPPQLQYGSRIPPPKI